MDEALRLELLTHDRDGRPRDAEHVGEKVLRDRELVGSYAILCGEHPARVALLCGMEPVARHRARESRQSRLRIADEPIEQRSIARCCLNEGVNRHA
jgi:hypothetical protein